MRRFFVVSLAGVFAFVLGVGPASAQYVGGTPPIVGPIDVGGPEGGVGAPEAGVNTSVLGVQFRTTPPVVGVTPSPVGNVAVLGSPAARGGVAPQVQVQGAQVRRLVVTGADIVTLSLLALASVIGGTVLVRRARRAEG